MTTETSRPKIVGPDGGPEPPYPLYVSGTVVKGFGRGSKELGVPTANIPIEGLTVGGHDDLESGVYFGWAGLDFHSAGAPHGHGVLSALKQASIKAVDLLGGIAGGAEDDDAEEGWDGKGRVHPMVMSIGWNPYYKNEKRSVEVHLLHNFTHDFYGSHLNLVILGFVRPEKDYESKEALIDDIKTDIDVTGTSLGRPAWAKYRKDKFLRKFPEGHDPNKEYPPATALAL